MTEFPESDATTEEMAELMLLSRVYSLGRRPDSIGITASCRVEKAEWVSVGRTPVEDRPFTSYVTPQRSPSLT